jgi:hypothetical protein
MARSSKPRRAYTRAPDYRLLLTRGGEAELIDLADDETVWSSRDDEEFMEEFPDFLQYSDVHDILDYLERDALALTTREADDCEVVEEYLTPSQLAGLVR